MDPEKYSPPTGPGEPSDATVVNSHAGSGPAGSSHGDSSRQPQARVHSRDGGTKYPDQAPESQEKSDPELTKNKAVPLADAVKDRRKSKSAPDAINTVPQSHHHDHHHNGHEENEKAVSPPGSPIPMQWPPRISFQIPPPAHARKSRDSEEFDRRYDGPFGRPSISMARRQSSIQLAQPPQIFESGELGAVETAESRTRLPGSSIATTLAEGATFQPEPPKLNYTLRTRKFAIFFFWTVIVFDSVVMPIALYFGLWYGVGPGNPANTKLSANTVFSIVTAALGGASIMEYFVRFWRLWKKGSTCRVS